MATERSAVLPNDPFDIQLSSLIGRPNGAHVPPTVVQAIDDYGNVTSYMVQTVRAEAGPYVFVMQVNAQGTVRYVLPPNVLRLMDGQRERATTQIRRRHGKRLAEERGLNGTPFTPEMRKKALETRKRNAAKRKKKGGRA